MLKLNSLNKKWLIIRTIILLLVLIALYNFRNNIGYIKNMDNTFRNNTERVDHNLDRYKDTEQQSLLRFLFKSKNGPKTDIPMIKPDFSKINDFAIYWLGHSNAIIEIDNKRIIIDPVFANAGPLPMVVKRYNKPVINRNELPKIDYVLITHNHYDHLEKKTVKKLKDSIFIVPKNLSYTLEKWGVNKNNIVELDRDEKFKKDNLSIIASKAVHFSGRWLTDSNKTSWNSYIIQDKNKKIFWGGDTGYSKHFKEIGDKYGPFDIVALEIDAWNARWADIHMFPHEVIKATKDLKGNYLLPIHWAVYDLALHPWKESINMVVDWAKKDNVKLLTPKIGEKIDNDNLPNEKWWNNFL